MSTTGVGKSRGNGLAGVSTPLLALLIPGPRELFVVVVVAFLLYGRSGARVLQATRQGRAASPWVRLLRAALGPIAAPAPRRRAGTCAPAAEPPAPPASRMGGRLYWALVIVAATAVAAWIATRTVMHYTASLSP